MTKTQNGRSKPAPDLIGSLAKSQRKVKGKTLTAAEIADSFETEAKKLQTVADILRGTT